MKKTTLWLTALTLLTAASCKKSDNSTDPDTAHLSTTNDIKVPAGFTWENSRNVNITVAITDSRFKDAVHQISVYNGDPYDGGVLLSQGSAKINTPFVSRIYLSNQVTELYVMKTAPDKSQIIQKVTADKTDVAVTIGATDPSVVTNSSSSNGLKVQDTAPVTDCNSGCNVPVITASKSNVDVSNGNVLCITGSNITVNFRTVSGGTIRVCGTNVTLQNLNLTGSATLLISASGSVNFTNFKFNSATASFVNYGTVNYTGAFPDNGIFTNNGTFNCSGDFDLSLHAGVFTNNSNMKVGGNFNNSCSSAATNNASLTVTDDFESNSGSYFYNKCTLNVGGNYNHDGVVYNYSLIKVAGLTTIGSNTLYLINGAMLSTNNLNVSGTIYGSGSTSLVKITGNTATISGLGLIIRAVQVYAVHGISSSSASHIILGASQDNSVLIPVTDCNGEGNGTPAIIDTDNDGVADNLDDYPTDPAKAYNVTGATGTLAFEDQWPRKGDFDLNDLVITYKYKLVTNAANKVVSIDGTYSLLATGGNFGNAFAIEFPVAASKAKSLTINAQNGTFEAGQSNAVVVLFKDMRREMAVWNTKSGDNLSSPINYSVSFNITDGPLLSDFGLDAYNPFIWNASRGVEAHLLGKKPTTLADASFFGANDDNTNVSAGRYYVTKTGLPYAINLPTATYAYPFEGIDITQTYLHFADWAQSGGTSYTDWYSNSAAGYRNLDNIFH